MPPPSSPKSTPSEITAAVRTDAGLEITARPAPSPGAGEALLRPTLLAVGPADARASGPESPFRGVLGHQFVGRVEATGEDTPPDLLGSRVVADVNIIPTSSPMARRGLGQHAPERTVLGLLGRDGCLAGRFVVPARNLTRVPDAVPDDRAIFAEPLASALHTASLVRLEARSFITVVGDSLIALLCAQVMTRLNATVRLLASTPRRFELCDKWGVKCRAIGDVGLRADQDVVVECTGTTDGVRHALGLVRPRGSVILRAASLPVPGEHAPGEHAADLSAVVLNELELIGARCGRVAEAIDALEHGYRGEPVQTAGLATKPRPFGEVADALAAAGAGRELKPLLLPPE